MWGQDDDRYTSRADLLLLCDHYRCPARPASPRHFAAAATTPVHPGEVALDRRPFSLVGFPCGHVRDVLGRCNCGHTQY